MIYYVLSLIYLILFILFRFVQKKPIRLLDSSEAFSVVIVTNKGLNRKYLKTFLDYANKYEVVVAFDRCDTSVIDESLKILDEFKINYKYLPIYEIEDGWVSSKKYALNLAIKESSYNKIVTLDDDTFVSKDYFEFVSKIDLSVTKYFLGIVKPYTDKNTFFSYLEKLDYIGFNLLSISLLKFNVPIYSNANNQIFHKNSFFDVNPLEKSRRFISGDDTFTLMGMSKKFRVGSFYLASASTYTEITGLLKKFLFQRYRWVSKSDQNKNLKVIIFSYFSYFYYLYLFIMFFINFEIFYFNFFIKFLADFVFLYSSLVEFKEKKMLFFLPFVELFQIIYVVLVSPIAVFFKPKKWNR